MTDGARKRAILVLAACACEEHGEGLLFKVGRLCFPKESRAKTLVMTTSALVVRKMAKSSFLRLK